MLGWERRVFRSQPRPCLKEQCELSLWTMWVHKEGIWDSAVKLDALRGQVKASTQEWYEDKLPWDKMPQNECQVCIYLLICSFKSLLHGVYMAMGKRENKSIYSSQQSHTVRTLKSCIPVRKLRLRDINQSFMVTQLISRISIW